MVKGNVILGVSKNFTKKNQNFRKCQEIKTSENATLLKKNQNFRKCQDLLLCLINTIFVKTENDVLPDKTKIILLIFSP